MDADGTLRPERDRRWLIARARCSHVTFAKHVAVLAELGIFERRYVGRIVGTGEYRHTLVLTVGERFRWRSPGQAAKSLRIPVYRPDQRKESSLLPTTLRTSPRPRASVGDLTTGSRVRPIFFEPAVSDADRRAVDNDWWRLAYSRTDLPGLRPGYSDRMTEVVAETAAYFAALPWCETCRCPHDPDGFCTATTLTADGGLSGPERARAELALALERR
jgi:hypothetical protein